MRFPQKMLLVLCSLVGACASGPEARGIEVTDDFKVYNQDKSMFTLEYMVNDHYNEHLEDLWQSAKIYWTDTKCPYKDDLAVIYEGKCYYGRMWSCGEIYVAKKLTNQETTCGTALLHEFGHCIRQALGMNTSGDDHWDDEFWTVVAEASMVSCERSWTAREIRQEVLNMKHQHLTQLESDDWEYDYSIYLEE